MVGILGLHGSCGHPGLLEPFLSQVAPDAPCYLPTGTISDGNGFTFFARRADGSIPEASLIDLAEQSLMPGGCIAACGLKKPLIVGFSSGAIFGSALLAVAPERFAGAILMRPQPISEDFVFPALAGKPVLVLSGLQDVRRKPEHARLVTAQLLTAGAVVTFHEIDTGHGWTAEDIGLAKEWLAETLPPEAK